MTAPVGVAEPPIYRPRSAVFWVFVGALVVGAVALVRVYGIAFATTLDAQVALAPFWLLFVVVLVAVLGLFDPFRSMRHHPQVLAAAAALGGVTAVAMAVTGNQAVMALWSLVLPPETLSAWSAALTAPIVEEAAKAACAMVVVVLGAAVCRRPAHAFVVGMFAGLGFDVVEDLAYASAQAIGDLDSDLTGAGGSFAVRVLTSFPAHWAYTGLVTAGVFLLLPRAEHPFGRGRRYAVAAVLIAAGPLMHAIWDSPGPTGSAAALGVMAAKVAVNTAIFVALAGLVIGTERRWVATRLDAATDRDTDGGIGASLLTRRRRRRLRRTVRREHGRRAAREVGRRQRELLDALQVDAARPPA